MASAVVPSVAKNMGDLLSDLLIQEALFLYGVDDDVQWIRTELTRMQCFLKDADSRSEKKDERVKNWVAEIIDVSYCAEDVIETFICSQSVLRKRRGFAEWVERRVCIFCELITRHNIGKQIERIKLKINDISTSRQTFGIRDINEGRLEASSSSQSLQEHRRLSTALQESEVVGLLEEMNALRVQLIKGEQRHCVVSIVGMGGSGKTTLAKKIYHDVKEDFDCRAFIYLSQQYEIKEILMNILLCVKSLSPEEIEKIEKMNVSGLGRMLHNHLREKKYLVVIDDIWSIEDWDAIKLIFPNGASQSRVMLTTRNKEVALHADPLSRPHDMRLLKDDEGWELFMKKIFPGGDPSTACPSHLEKTGRKILAKCGGLPLAILVLGGLLARKDKTFNAWSRVLERVNWHLNESSEKCMEILALSYWDLPLYLKPCFLYLGLFPEDYKISSRRLIRLWIAEGFIQYRDNEILEDTAEDYLEDLVGRSMIQVASRKSNGSVGKCCIHDLLRDLSISEARQNNFFTIHNDRGTSSSSTSVRRLALHCYIDGYENRNRSTVTLRSILSFLGHEVDWEKLRNTCGKLRVVDALDEQIIRDKFPKEVREFVLLRYLELGFYTKVNLPSSIGNLYNLETLRLSGYGTLPNAICNLKQLRHLCTYGFDIDEHPQLNNLRSLQTLCLAAGNWINDGLDELTTLRKLGICGDLRPYHKALSNSIHKLWNLRSLKLFRGCSIPPFMPFTRHLHLYKMFLEGSMEKPPEIPPHLVELTLVGSGLNQDDISVRKKLIIAAIGPSLKPRDLHQGSNQSWRLVQFVKA
ncbi:hypothetical protein AAC387_Pa07g0393 [Persea americana]